MKQSILIALGLALACPALLDAAPAPWYHWRSRGTGAIVCSQTPLGAGWVRADGPYRDARCEKPLPAK
jgi:hypothetical protein